LRPLDLFILMLVRDGLHTPYAWQARASVSLGASLPAVERLLSGDFVSEAKRGARGRREFTLTHSGRNELKKLDLYLERALDEEDDDLETVLRLVCMAISEGKLASARKLSLQAADQHARRSRRARKQAVTPAKGSGVAELYLAALSLCETNRQDATAKGLTSMSSLFDLGSDRIAAGRSRRKTGR
jgi:DNA-binding PadR family transcriptional regulator